MSEAPSSLFPQLALVAAVSASHMSMPNHWLPYSLVARAHGWSLRTALVLTFLGAFGHVSVTLCLMLVISELGSTLVSESLYRVLSTAVLLLGGLYYLYTYFIARRRDSCCEPDTLAKPRSSSAPPATTGTSASSVSTAVSSNADGPAVHRAAALSLILLTTLSPCVGSMPVLLAVLAPPIRAATVVMAGAVLLASAAAVMMSLVAVSFVGAATLDIARIRRHERLILGAGLVALALLTFFVFSNHHHHHHHRAMGGDKFEGAAVHGDISDVQHEHHHHNGIDGDHGHHHRGAGHQEYHPHDDDHSPFDKSALRITKRMKRQ